MSLQRKTTQIKYNMMPMDCIRDGIAEYTPRPSKPWDSRRIAHLYNRIGFGANHQQIATALTMNPTDLIDQIVDSAVVLPLAPEPYWADWTTDPVNDYAEGEAMGSSFNSQANTHRREWTVQLFNDMLSNGFRDKLILFWHNHFVTQFSTYTCSSYLHKYYKVLGEYSLGNFRDFVYEIGKTPAMVRFLNADQSTKYHPNENYARELLELFTMGVDNGYTQEDIVEISKALTGFQARGCRDTEFRPDYFDTDDKTIFGQTGPWNYDDVHDLIFEYRPNNVAEYICEKLYRYFISTDVDLTIVNELAVTFKNNNFELAPVFKQLFKSEHFFDDKNIGVRIKSPAQYFMSFIHQAGFEYDDDLMNGMRSACEVLGQYIWEPIDVAGWQGQRSWLNEDTLTRRWDLTEQYLFNDISSLSLDNLVDLAKAVSGNSNDPAYVTQTFIDHFLPIGFNDAEAYSSATNVFKGEIPQNYFDQGFWNLDWSVAGEQLLSLLVHLIRQPEFQLY